MRSIKYLFSPDYKNIEIKKCVSSLHSSKAHLHNDLSIALIEKGSSVTELLGKKYIIHEKSILMIPAKVVHKCKPIDLDNWNFRMIYVDNDWIKQIFCEQSNEIKFTYKELDDNNYTKARSAFMKIEELSQSDSSTEYNISSESDLINNLSSILLFQNDVYKKTYNPSQDLKLLKDIQEFIEMSYLKKLMLQDLVNISGLSKYYLIRKFEQEYGISPHQYLTSLRINHARKIMRRNKNISDVALEAGFYDQSHFTKTFKEHTGITPMKYLNDISR